MLKVTKDGIKREGPVRELSLEDRMFIRQMFEEFSTYQTPHLFEDGEILPEDEYHNVDILDSGLASVSQDDH